MYEDKSRRILADRYLLLEKIGEGGAAEVYRAMDERLNRIVAVKLLRPQFTTDEQSRSRFAIEAKAAAGLSHANIVDVYDFGEAPDGSMFIVMQCIDGENLKDMLQKRGHMTAGEVIAIARQVCSALTMAHDKGLIHRDVKPQNIMIDRSGTVRLTDFGVVKALSGGPALTQSGMTFGTAAYLSPEQATGASIGPPSDIYALGCVMYELLSGTPPFVGDNTATVAYKQVWEQPTPLHNLVPEVPTSLEAVIMRCLNKDPAMRYPSAPALAADLERISASFNQVTEAISLGSVAAMSMADPRKPSETLPPAEMSQPIPMPVSPYTTQAVPPVRVQTTQNYPPPVAAPPPPPIEQGPRAAGSSALYPRVAGMGTQAVNVAGQQRNLGWVPILLIVLVGLGVCGFGIWQSQNFLGVLGGGTTPTPTIAAIAQSPTPTLEPTIQASLTIAPTAFPPTSTPQPQPTDTTIPTPPSTDTSVPQEATATPAPVPTDTAVPQPEVTDTPALSPPPDSTETLVTPSPAEVTDTPVLPQIGNTITLDAPDFTGGYTSSSKHYHKRTAQWVYGQGTRYHTMTANFNVDQTPQRSASLTIEGVDSEDGPKTLIRIEINGTVIYEGPDPLPNDTKDGPNGKGNWGNYTWQFEPSVLQQGTNTLSISNLDPSDKIGFPLFFMLDYATVTWI